MAGKSPPFKQRIKDALEVARQAGFSRVRVSTRDGATFDFSDDPAEGPPSDGVAHRNDFDAIIQQRRKNLKNEEKP